MIGIEDVFEVRSASSRETIASSFLKSSIFAASFSTIASTTRSQPANSARSVVNAMSRNADSPSCAVSFPDFCARCIERSTRALPASTSFSSGSLTTTSSPARAHTSAMPEPISPQPITPTR